MAMPTRQRLVAYGMVGLSCLVGACSLLGFYAFLFLGSFELVALDLSEKQSLSLNAALCLLFFVQHSGMIRKSFQGRLATVVPPLYHGAIYSSASGIVLLVLLTFWQRSDVVLWSVDGAASWTIRILFAGAILGSVWGIRALGSFDSFGAVAIADSLRGRKVSRLPLTIRGPYRWVRHPLYTFTLVMIWACPAITPDRLLLAILFTVWMVLGTMLEERDLVSDFGEGYRQYQRRVPMLVPWRRGDW